MPTDVLPSDAPKSLSNLFLSRYHDKCQRCDQRVYQVEKVGPVNEVIFHKQCFRCCECGQYLSMKTYYTDPTSNDNKEVYCTKHAPKSPSRGLDANAMGIRAAMSATSNFEAHHQGYRGLSPHINSEAMFVSHPLSAQGQLKNQKQQPYNKHHYPAFLAVRAKEKLYKAQEELERKQREDEDKIMSNFLVERGKETERVEKEIEEEWEVQLKQLSETFETDLSKTKMKSPDRKAMTVKYEKQKEQLKQNMTVKMQRKKEAATTQLQKTEQMKTSSMVKKHSEQMLELFKSKQDEVRQQLEEELKQEAKGQEDIVDQVALDEAMAALALPTEVPPPHAPRCRKRDLYQDPSVFKDLDEDVFSVAEQEQSTFTDLVMQLTKLCVTDLQKVRAIFRWITVKDLNVIDFDDTKDDDDSPMGLLRGIKCGTETYHTLFMRLCSYAGLGCEEIKGHSKSVGYEPGMKIREDSFQNTWNAVLVEGDWWPVQCNWGARHLVLNKDVQEKAVKSKKQDKIRYQYDEHYFLTDPDEFIQEFWAQDPEWQLLEIPISLEEFESMPFVRSVFFHYALEFDKSVKAVLYTDNKGGAEVKLQVPKEFEADLVFHYQIRFADRERRNETEYNGAKLERFVFHSLVDGYALFSVHVPAPSAYFLEIFANKIDDTNKIGDDPNATMMPFRLKCACKFKIVCEELVGKMHPLPNCASGEWGPSKGRRHFSLKAVSHKTGVVNVDNEEDVKFKLPRPLHFLTKLRMNNVEDSLLERYVSHTVHDNLFVIKIRPPQPGQYGLDIYARPEDAADNHTLAHACKYLINCTRVNDPIDLPVSKVDASQAMSKDRWGPSPHFEELGLKNISHKEATIDKSDLNPLTIELSLSEPVKLSFHLLREPNEDCRDKVALKENGKKAKFTFSFSKAGNYLFAIYARKKKDTNSDMLNVYNYMIKYAPPEGESTLKKKKKGLFKK